MKFKTTISTINNINLICVLFLLLFKYIFCQCTNDDDCNKVECENECKESIYGSKKFYCKGLASSTYKYFYIFHYNENDNECRLIDECPDKIVFGTDECVLDCVDYIEVGDYCFTQTEANSRHYVPEIVTANKKKYKCPDYTYIQIIGREKKSYICVDDPSKAPPEEITHKTCPSDYYYDSDKMECVDSCENNKKITVNQNYKECTNECSKDKYEYKESDDIPGSTKIYCLDNNCPNKTPFFYRISSLQSPKCQKNCNSKHFYKDNNECSSHCDGLYLYDELKDYFKCISPSNDCPSSSHPYRYQNACLNSCRHTQLNPLIKKTTYLFPDEKICVDNCYNYNEDYYSDDESFLCVKDCKETNNKYHYNHKCINSCQDKGLKYYTKNSLESSSSNVKDEYECVNTCPDGYIYKEKICIKNCPKLDLPYIDLETKSCTTCNIPVNPNSLGSGEGFIIDIEKNGNNIICRKSCPSSTYYKFNDNICYDSSINNDECYFSENNPNICYSSCKDITGIKSEKRVNGRNICFTEELDCGNQYYFKKDNVKRCIDDDDTFISNRPKYVRECTKHNFNYLRDKQCIEDCYSNTEYKIEPTSTIYDGITVLGRCCVSPDCDINYPYYSEEEKILKKNCNLKLIEKEGDNIIKSSKGTCVSECPEDYPYESEDGKLCLLSCPKFYYNIGDKKKCIDNCKSIGKFYFDGEKECKESCTKKISEEITNYYYYDDSDNACLYSCKERNMHSLKVIDSPQRCIDSYSGSNKYYFESNYICLPSCDGGFYKSVNENICVNQCEAGQFVINGNTCNDECTDQEPFISTETSSPIVYNKCVYSCFEVENMNYKYYINDTKKWRKNVPQILMLMKMDKYVMKLVLKDFILN